MGPWIRARLLDRMMNARALTVAGVMVTAAIAAAAVVGDRASAPRPAERGLAARVASPPALTPPAASAPTAEACRDVVNQLREERARARARMEATRLEADLDRRTAELREPLLLELEQVSAALDDRSRHRPRGRARRELLARLELLHAQLDSLPGGDGFVCGNELEDRRRDLQRQLDLERQRVADLSTRLAACHAAGR